MLLEIIFRNLCVLRMARKLKLFILIKNITYLESKTSRAVGRIVLLILSKRMEQNGNTNCRVVMEKM